MRISDWSSDVCSSDLLDRLQQAEQQRVERDRQQGAGQDEVAALLGQQPVGDAEAGEDEGEFADLGEAGRDGQRGGQRMPEGQHDQEGGERLAADARSEEQTSELQSLMRIPYAVFCLKKKQ